MRAIFQKKAATGVELLTELTALRKVLGSGKSTSSNGLAQQLTGCQQPAAAANAGADALQSLALGALKQTASDMATKMLSQWEGDIAARSGGAFSIESLRGHLDKILEDRKLLSEEKVTLPTADYLSDAEQQQVLTMAALVVGARVSGKLLARAQADFDGLEGEYASLIERREKAATLLFDVLQQRRAVSQPTKADKALEAKFTSAFDKREVAMLSSLSSDMSVGEFSADFATQNLAMQWLRKIDPQAYKAERAQAEGLIGRSRAYSRAVVGVAAFGSVVAVFGKEVSTALKGKQPQQLIALAPLAAEFAKDALPIVKVAATVAYEGTVQQATKAVTAPMLRAKSQDGTVVELKNSAALMAWLKEQQIDTVFADALFRDDSPGLLQRIYQCHAVEASRMLDSALTAQERNEFATTLAGLDDDDPFLFSQVLSDSAHKAHAKTTNLVTQLLKRDHRSRTDDTTKVLGKTQTAVAQGAVNWSDEQVLRLIFANRDGLARSASLQLGTWFITPVPSMRTVYAYELQADGCRKAVTALLPAPSTPAWMLAQASLDLHAARPQ